MEGGAESGAPAPLLAIADRDLIAIIEAWPDLPEAVRAGIVAMVQAAGKP